MVRGLAMAETTPGPLIQVVQFVGLMGAYRNPGSLDPRVAGLLASLLVTWVTYVPCFLWIFLGAPYIEALRENRAVSDALTGITAAVVGVIANLAVFFAVHTLFDDVSGTRSYGPLRLQVPEWSTISPGAVVIAAAAFVLLFRLKWSVLRVLGTCALSVLRRAPLWLIRAPRGSSTTRATLLHRSPARNRSARSTARSRYLGFDPARGGVLRGACGAAGCR